MVKNCEKVAHRNAYLVSRQPWRKDENPEETARRIKKQESLLEYLYIVSGESDGIDGGFYFEVIKGDDE